MTRRIHALVALAAVGAAGVTFGVLFVLARYGVDPHHDGLVFKGALDVLDGQVPLRDSYGQYGALLPVLQAAFLDVFGPTLLVLKGSAVAFYALSAALLVVLWRSMVPLVLAFGTWLLWLLSQPEVTDTTTTYEFSGIFLAWSSVYALGTSTAACVLLVVAHKRPASLIWASAASGALAGLTIHLRTPTGLMVSIGLLVGLAVWAPGSVRRVITSAMAFVGGLVVVVGVVLGWLALVGALGDWWQQIIVWPRTWASGVGEGILHFYWSFARDRLFAFIPLVLFTMGVLALADLIAAAIAQRWRGGRTSLVCFSVAGWGGCHYLRLAVPQGMDGALVLASRASSCLDCYHRGSGHALGNATDRPALHAVLFPCCEAVDLGPRGACSADCAVCAHILCPDLSNIGPPPSVLGCSSRPGSLGLGSIRSQWQARGSRGPNWCHAVRPGRIHQHRIRQHADRQLLR